jgi:hypothetical protein
LQELKISSIFAKEKFIGMEYNLDKWYIVDIEAKGLLPDLKSSEDLHCVSVGWEHNGEFKVKSTNKEEDIAKVFENPDNTIVGHFFLAYDLPALKIMFPNIKFRAKIIDSLAISHYLYNDRLKHGLEDYGIEFGFEKVKIEADEWLNLSYEKAIERCERDCLINYYVWKKELALLRELYINDNEIHSPISRANFKMILLNIQEDNKIKLDVELCKKNLAYLEEIISEKVEELKSIMPKIPVKATRTKPKNMHKKTGELSVAGENWMRLIKGCNLPEDYDGVIDEVIKYEEPNPSSSTQMKAFLVSKGWKAKLFKDGANGKVAQLRDDNKELCSSIKELIKTVPELEALDGLSVAQHRAGYLKAFLDTMTEDGYVTASWSGMAKTWRVKHGKPIVNLPSNNSQHGELVRSCLIAPKGKVFVNADLSSLEDKTKQCSIYPYAPDYVETLNTPGYDAHLAIGLKAGFLSQEEVDFFNWYKKDNKSREDLSEIFKVYTDEELSEQFKKISKIRKSSKVVNYACTYSASPKKIAETAEISLKEAQTLHKAYWDTNISIKQYTDSLTVKVVDGRNWIYNPFTKLWLILTADHIKFSACNQNFGACVFDTFLWFLVQAGVKPIMTIHDELSFYIDEGQEDWARKVIKESMDKVNKVFNQPIKFESEPEFAKSYGAVH